MDIDKMKPKNIKECVIQLIDTIEESRDPHYSLEDKGKLLELVRDELYAYIQLKTWSEEQR